MAEGDWGYRGDGTRVFIPDTRVKKTSDKYSYEPLRGMGYVVAVFSGEKCIGWLDVGEFGYGSVKEFMASNRAKA